MLVLTDIQKVTLTISPTTKAGNPAPVENVSWSSSNEAVVTVEASEDGLSAVIVTTGALGTAQVNVSADAKIGDGVAELAGVLDVEVKASEAVALGIVAGTPEEK